MTDLATQVLARGTIHATNDSTKLQTNDIRVFDNELFIGVERMQPYGHISIPVAPNSEKVAECVVGFVNGSRSHPIILAVDDRRYRPTGGKPGDTGTYHYSGASLKFTDSGFTHDQGPKKQPYTITVGSGSAKIEDSKITLTVGGTSIVLTDGKIALGGDGASTPVMLESGPSTLVFATK